jgi:hypothetical protein
MNLPRGLQSLLALALLTAPLPAQDAKQTRTIAFDGVEVFRFLLKENGFQSIDDIRALAKLPAVETVVIVFGTMDGLSPLSDIVGNLTRFREAGGNLLIASDYAESKQLSPLGVGILGLPVEQAADHAYRDTPSCPRLTDFGSANPALFVSVHSLATNRPSCLVLQRDSDLQTLASFPSDCGLVLPRPPVFLSLRALRRGRPVPYIVGSPASLGPHGRALVLAGHGVFTNGMLLQRDNDNFLFANNCLKWLREGPEGRARTRALFLVDGEIVTSFDASLQPPPLPIPMPTTKLVNQLLQGLERERFFQRLLEDNLDLDAVVRGILLIGTVLLLCYAAKKLFAARHRTETAAPIVVGPFATGPPDGPWIEQRHRAQAEGNYYGEQAVALSRQWFVEAAGLPATHWLDPAAAAPDVVFQASWWHRRRLARELDRVLRLARQPAPPSLRWPQILHPIETLHELSRAAADGRLRVVVGPASRIP